MATRHSAPCLAATIGSKNGFKTYLWNEQSVKIPLPRPWYTLLRNRMQQTNRLAISEKGQQMEQAPRSIPEVYANGWSRQERARRGKLAICLKAS